MYPNVLTEARTSIWLIRPDKLDAIFDMLESREAGIHADAETLAKFAADNQERQEHRILAAAGTKQQPRDVKAVGVLPIYGTIVQRGNMFTEASGTASCDKISRQIDMLLENDQVGTILADIDSPGGTVCGVPELAHKIRSLRGGGKALVAHVNAEAGSAAYWLASAFDEIVVTPSGSVGSIGAYCVHTDASGYNERLGVKRRYIAYGKYKTEGNQDEPMTDESIAAIQEWVDKIGRSFEEAIAANRDQPVSKVRADWGQGRMLDADQGKAVGMVDKVEAFDDTIRRLMTPRARVTRRTAHAKRWLET